MNIKRPSPPFSEPAQNETFSVKSIFLFKKKNPKLDYEMQ